MDIVFYIVSYRGLRLELYIGSQTVYGPEKLLVLQYDMSIRIGVPFLLYLIDCFAIRDSTI